MFPRLSDEHLDVMEEHDTITALRSQQEQEQEEYEELDVTYLEKDIDNDE